METTGVPRGSGIVVVWVCLLAAGCVGGGEVSVEDASGDAGGQRDIGPALDSAETGTDTGRRPETGGGDVAADTATGEIDTGETDVSQPPMSLSAGISTGSLDVEASQIDGRRVELVGRNQFYDGEWKWFHARVEHVRDRRPEFEIGLDFADGPSALADHRMVYSTDGTSWQFFDQNELDNDQGVFRFGNDEAFEADSVQVALGIPYSPDRLSTQIDDIEDSRWVEPTDSSDASLAVGQSPGGTSPSGRTVDSQTIYGFEITDPDASGPKSTIVLTGGVHANEPTGNHILEGMIRFLVGGSDAAAELRREARFLVYPMVNPDGYAAGLDRASLSAPDTDPNRIWSDEAKGAVPEVETVLDAMASDSGGDIDYLLDFHAAVGNGTPYAYMDGDRNPTGIEMRYDPFWQNLTDGESVDGRDASLGYDTAMKYGWQALDAEFVATFEPYYKSNWTRGDYHAFGESIGRAFAKGRSPAGDLRVDMDFDSGSLDVGGTQIHDDEIHLAGRDNYNSGSWKWIYFRAENVAGRHPTFELGLNFASGSSRLTDHEMVYSYDRDSWSFFDNNVYDSANDEYRFDNDEPFSRDTVYIAYGLPYPYEMVSDLVDQANQSQWVSPTQSADTDLVIGQSPGGTDDLGRTIPSHDLYGFKLTDSGASGSKEEVVLVGGVHSNETNGSHTLHGLVDFLLGNSSEAQQLRKDTVFYVYPMVNPDGRVAGYNRSTVEAANEDPNRQWSSSNWSNNTDIRRAGKAMMTDTSGNVDYLVDFHSQTSTGRHFAYLDEGSSVTGLDMDDSTFWNALTDREPSLWTKDASFYGRTCMRFGVKRLDAEFSSTVETRFRPGENIDRFHRLGTHFGEAFYEAISK